jgi:hypothetical protein
LARAAAGTPTELLVAPLALVEGDVAVAELVGGTVPGLGRTAEGDGDALVDPLHPPTSTTHPTRPSTPART